MADDEGSVPAATTSLQQQVVGGHGRGGHRGVGGHDADLVDQVGQLAHRADEVPRGDLAGVPGGDVQGGPEGGPRAQEATAVARPGSGSAVRGTSVDLL